MKSDIPAPPPHPHGRFLMSIVWVIAILSVIQIGAALFIIPKFQVIFSDMLPDQELPMLSSLVIQGRWAIIALACLVPAVGWVLVRSSAPPRFTATVLAVGVCWSVVQIPLMASAMLLPITRIVRYVAGGG